MIGVALLVIPASPLHDKPTLGLDLQGGLEVTLKAVPPANRPLQKSDLDRSVEILGQTAQLELFDLEANLAPPSNSGGFAAPKESLYELLAGQQALVGEDTKT